MRTFLSVFLLFFVSNTSLGQANLQFLGQNPPSATPQIFAPDIISKQNQSEFGSIFSTDGSDFFYAVDINGKAEIRYSKIDNDSWTTPVTVIGHETYSFNDPMLSPDEKRLYYISNRPRNGEEVGDYDIWYSNKLSDGWSEPINAGKNINSSKNEYYISFTTDGTMYYSSNKLAEKGMEYDYDIYASKHKNGEFQKSTRLGNAINTKAYEADVFIAPDESYIIFCTTRQGGLGKGDLYISFKQENGEWSKATNLKEPINSGSHELCPWVTKDGKYFFYTSNQDIYWVTTEILKQKK